MCGDCPQRPITGGGCYVGQGLAPAYYSSPKKGELRPGTAGFPDITNFPIRLTAYGDPSAVPPEVFEGLVMASCSRLQGTSLRRRSNVGRPQLTCYTHQWRKPYGKHLRKYCMASTENKGSALEAQAEGWRTLRIRPFGSKGPDPRLNEIQCPAITDPSVKCSDCLKCSGELRLGGRANISLDLHGRAKESAARKVWEESDADVNDRIALIKKHGMKSQEALSLRGHKYPEETASWRAAASEKRIEDTEAQLERIKEFRAEQKRRKEAWNLANPDKAEHAARKAKEKRERKKAKELGIRIEPSKPTAEEKAEAQKKAAATREEAKAIKAHLLELDKIREERRKMAGVYRERLSGSATAKTRALLPGEVPGTPMTPAEMAERARLRSQERYAKLAVEGAHAADAEDDNNEGKE